MKKVVLILMCFFMIGCTNREYDNFVLKAKDSKISDVIPFDINFYIDDSEEILIYQVIIDNSKLELNNIKAIVIHDVKTDNIFPSIGVVDEPIDLNNEVKGINLIGRAPKQNIEFKVYIEANNTSYAYIYRYNI